MPEQEINNLTRCLVSSLSPERVFLFGSYANGTFREDSDLDFYIVVRDDVRDLADLSAKAYRSIRQIKNRPVDIVIGTAGRFEQLKFCPSLENQVFQYGALLYGT